MDDTDPMFTESELITKAVDPSCPADAFFYDEFFEFLPFNEFVDKGEVPTRYLHLSGYSGDWISSFNSTFDSDLLTMDDASTCSSSTSTTDISELSEFEEPSDSFFNSTDIESKPRPLPDLSFFSQIFNDLCPSSAEAYRHLAPQLANGPVTICPAYKSTSVAHLMDPKLYLRNSNPSAYPTKIDVFPIMVDSGCSVATSGFLEDFEGKVVPGNFGHIQTANGTAKIRGFGLVNWHTVSEDGDPLTVRVPCYHVPEIPLRLFSPQDYARYHEQDTSKPSFLGNGAWLYFHHESSDLDKEKVAVFGNRDPHTGLFYFYGEDKHDAPLQGETDSPLSSPLKAQPTCRCHPTVNVHDPKNVNLSRTQKNLLLDHSRLGHVRMNLVQSLYECSDDVSPTFLGNAPPCKPCLHAKDKGQISCPLPLCQTCQVAKARRRTANVKRSTPNRETTPVLRVDDLQPGDCISVDQYESSVRGRLPYTRGRERRSNRFCGGTLFYDHASSKMFVRHQVSLDASETVDAKRSVEREALAQGIYIKEYHSDNGIFSSRAFEESLVDNDQTIKKSGVGAKHQNAVAERAIGVVQNMARAMLLHLRLHWPDEFDPALWPFALDYAVWIFNQIPHADRGGMCPEELFSRTKAGISALRRARVFGCPTYVLDSRLQDGKKIPKWEPRARTGMFLGFSSEHSSMVGLILNIRTGAITPQFHVVYDERFETVTTDMSLDLSETWIDLWQGSREFYLDDWDPTLDGPLPELDPEFKTDSEPQDDSSSSSSSSSDDSGKQGEPGFPRKQDHPPRSVGWFDVEVAPPQQQSSSQPQQPASSNAPDPQQASTTPPDQQQAPSPLKSNIPYTPLAQNDPSDSSSSDDDDDDVREQTKFEAGEENSPKAPPSESSLGRQLQDIENELEEMKEEAESGIRFGVRETQFDFDNQPDPTTYDSDGNALYDDDDLPEPESPPPPIPTPRKKKKAGGIDLLDPEELSPQFRLRSGNTKSDGAHKSLAPGFRPVKSRLFSHVRAIQDTKNYVYATLNWETVSSESLYQRFHELFSLYMDQKTKEVLDPDSAIHPFSLASKMESEDYPTFKEIMRMDPKERDLWFDSMDEELKALFDSGACQFIDRAEVQRMKKEIVKTTWAYRIKRQPCGTAYQRKSRLCVRGDLQRDKDKYGLNETFAPVVEWMTVRLLFTLGLVEGWTTASIDFKNAFTQAKLPEPIYLELPPGLEQANPEYKNKLIKVKTSLYGDRRAANLWFRKISKTLVNDLKFKASEMDPCLFVRQDCIIVLYVDDAIIMARNEESVQKLLDELKTQNYAFTRDGDFTSYLGVQIEKKSDGTIKMSQPHLARTLVDVTGMSDCTTVPTPSTGPLFRHLDSKPFDQHFSYRSAIGILQYLGNNTRPDCAYAINSCARFCIDPREPHGNAVKRIARYIKGTLDEGIIFKPDFHNLAIDCHVDADLAGGWNLKDPEDPNGVKSRTGFLLTFAGVPLLWKSKLQDCIALSTMESEYIALSTAMRSLVHVRALMGEICANFNMAYGDRVSTLSTVFEDNRACKILAETDPPRLTPRSKSLAIKYHWFRSHLGRKNGKGIVIDDVASALNKADFLTKSLTPEPFVKNRLMVQGW